MRPALKRAVKSPFTWAPALVCFELIALSVASEDLIPRRGTSDELHVAAPRLHFLTGRSLDRLHDGVSVPFDFQLSVASGVKTNVMERALERFVVSYDLWEEKFSVVRLRNLRKSNLRLSSNAAESWCLDNIFVPISRLPADHPLWAKLEIRSVDPKQDAAPEEPAISLTSLIEVFSRPARAQQEHWSLESSPFRLADLK